LDTGKKPNQFVAGSHDMVRPHETRALNFASNYKKNNGLIEDDDGPWGAPHRPSESNQEDIQWMDYIWRLCVSYRKLNKVTSQFPIRRCDDAVADIP
jgi:hypothetical protein